MNPLRTFAVRYLNARPLYDALLGQAKAGEFSVSLGLPSEAASAMADRTCDVALMPVAAAAELGGLVMVRGACIASSGPVRSVLIVSECPTGEIDELVLDLSSRTSVVLARLVFRQRYGREPRLLAARDEALLAEVNGKRGALVIGDLALRVEGKYAHNLDLASAWKEWTGLPFVFAAWFGRPERLEPSQEALFLAAKEEGLRRRDVLAEEYARDHDLSPASVRSYLHEAISYNFDEPEVAGLQRFYDEALAARLLPRTDVRFLGPTNIPSEPSLDTILSRAAAGERLSGREAMRLLAEASLFDLGLAADAVRKRKHPHNIVTYIVDRNINYTNVCTTSCRFCAFYRPVGHAEGYVLSREVLAKKMQEVVDAGGVQILLQGGLNPALRLSWYEDLFRWIKSDFGLGLHALSPEEILFIAELESLPVRTVLQRLRASGLDSLPGAGAEILVDHVRAKIAKAKCKTDAWLAVMQTAHELGMRSSATMMYGTVETAEDRVAHLLKLRELQDRTGGFTAFFCWDYQHEEETRLPAGEHGTVLYLRTQAVARLVLDNFDHIGASWVTQGPEIGQVALRFGADDFGSVMFEENVVSSAGTTFCMNAEAIEERVHKAGFRVARRNVHYQYLSEPR